MDGLKIYFGIIIALVLIFIISTVVDIVIKTDYELCLEKIAIKECENKGMSYYSHSDNYPMIKRFWCKEDLRTDESTIFLFLDEEIEGCKNETR